MERLLLIGIGGGLGSIFRYLVSTGFYKLLGRDFPYGTLAVNAIGSLLVGFLFVFLLEYFDSVAEQLRTFMLIGFLGGFTTFSTFTLESFNLLEAGDPFRAFLNVIVSVVLCLFLTWIGILLGRQL